MDAVRALSIGLVLLSHTVLFLPYGWTGQLLVSFAGTLGVEMFFSLSGFLIGRILLTLADQRLDRAALVTFFVRRWLRTLPLYFSVLLVLFLVGWPLFLADALLIHGFVPSRAWGLPPAWSLGVEEFSYLSFPLLMAGLVWARVVSRQSALLVTAGATIVAGWLLRSGYYFGGDPIGSDLEWFRSNPLLRIDACAYGVVLACVLRTRASRATWRPSQRTRHALLGCFAAVASAAALMVLVMYSLGEAHKATLGVLLAVYHVALFPALDLAALAAILGLLGARPMRMGALAAAVRFGSRTSYGLYLIHVPVFSGVASIGRGLLPNGVTSMAVALGLSALLAALAYKLIEAPALTWRDHRFPVIGAPMVASVPPPTVLLAAQR